MAKRNMKGIELPVNVLVIIAIAVLVLLGLIVIFSFAIGGASPIQVMLEKGPACQKYGAPNDCAGEGAISPNSITVNIDANHNGEKDDTIFNLCEVDNGCTKEQAETKDETALKKWCGCKVTEPTQ